MSMISYIMEFPQYIVEARSVSIRDQLYTDKALNYIYDNLCEKITLKELAEYLGKQGICVRAGLHCAPLAHISAGTLETGTLRFSASVFNTESEVVRLLKIIP